MSILIGYVSKDYSFIMSDGRATGTKATEFYDKTFKIGSDVIGGYVGRLEDVNLVLPILFKANLNNADEVAYCIENLLDDKPADQSYDADFFIIGKDANGILSIYFIGKSTNLKVEKRSHTILNTNFIPFGGSISLSIIYNIVKRVSETQLFTPYDKAKKMIEKISMKDETVNSNIFLQELKL